MGNDKDKYKHYIGNDMVINREKYGVIVDLIEVDNNGQQVFVFVTDLGKRVEASSYLRYLGIGRKVYPDGTDYAMRLRRPKSKTKNVAYVPSKNIRNIAFVNKKDK